jgi:glycosyltransferase involved in cell wall biosynthesis
MTFSVTHITFSSQGGAGQVADRLVEAQKDIGYKSSILKLTDSGVQSLALSNPMLFWTAVFDQYVIRTDWKNPLFGLYRKSKRNRIINNPRNKTMEIVHLHWISGTIPLTNLCNWVGPRKCVWTLHDMWPFTGGCHHSLDCGKYVDLCDNCPQVKKPFKRSVSINLQSKVDQISKIKNLRVVAPSNWIAAKARESRVFRGMKINVIPNPVDTSVFCPSDKDESRREFQIPVSSFVIGCSAANLSDPQKNIDELVRQTKTLTEKYPDVGFVLLAIGSGKIEAVGCEVKQTGLIENQKRMAVAYNAMDVFVSFAIAENSPLTLIEASASGVPTVCMDRGGMPEIVLHEDTGFVLSDYDEFRNCIEKLFDPHYQNRLSQNSRDQAVRRFSLDSVSKQYDKIYHELQ